MKLISVQIIEALNNAKKELEQFVTEGKMTSYENYKYYIGRIHGLEHAAQICHNTAKRSKDD
ncbi:MAG: hypothetical protein ACP5N7_05040 [Candidatus Pacearchaeota archaeon]